MTNNVPSMSAFNKDKHAPLFIASLLFKNGETKDIY